MQVDKIVVGELDTNCYLLIKDKKILIIDPGADKDKIIDKISMYDNHEVVGIIITHSHFDHIGAQKDIEKYYKVKSYSMSNMKEGINNIDCFSFNTIYFPGHLYDEIAIYFEDLKMMFAGDFIFQGSIGRTDLAGASEEDMKKSIKKVLEYPKDIMIYPGHGPTTILEDEVLMLNYFLSIL